MKNVGASLAALVAAAVVGTTVGPPAGSASAVAADLQVVTATSATNSTDAKSVTATCPSGTRVIGTGVVVDSPGGRVVLTGLQPKPTEVTATGRVNTGTPAWTLTAKAICAAAPAGLEIVTATSATDSASPKTVSAVCPPGRRVIGSGAEIIGGRGQVVIDEMRPFTTMVNATGDNTGSFEEPWSVRAHAICAKPLTGQQVVTRLSETNSSPTRSAQANCPPGKRLLGTGFDIVGGNGEVGAIQVFPLPAGNGVSAIEHRNYDSSWQLNSIAICGGLNLEVVTATSPSDASSPKSLTVTCPGDQRVVGTGLHYGGSNPGNVAVNAIVPTSGTVTVTGHADENGTLGNWTVSARAVCVNPLPGQQIIAATSATDSSASKVVGASCKGGKHVVGTGAAILGGGGQVSLDDVTPSLTGVTASGFEDDNGYAGAWSVTAYAICADPLADHQIVTASTVRSSFVAKSATATCPSDTRLLGTGFRLDGGGGEVRVENVQPGPNQPTNVVVQANEDDDGTTRNWRLTAYAICATP